MDSPIRQYLKQKDYRRHKLFRKINRRRKAERLLAIDAPMKELKKRLRRFGDGKDKNLKPWKALSNIDYDVVPDATFTSDKTGVGDIEYFAAEHPEGTTYPNGYHKDHPRPGRDVILYNPVKNDYLDIRLDALHIMPKDATYDVLNSLYQNEILHGAGGDLAWEAVDEWKEDADKYGANNIDSKELYIRNRADGLLRNMLIRGSKDYMENKGYYPDKEELISNYPSLLPYINAIQNYLETGERPANILPEVVVKGKNLRKPKKYDGGKDDDIVGTVTLPEVVVKPTFDTDLARMRINQMILDKKLRDQILSDITPISIFPLDGTVDYDYDSEYMTANPRSNEYSKIKHLYEIWDAAGRPKITSGGNSIFDKLFTSNNKNFRDHYNPLTNSIHLNPRNPALVSELSHAILFGDKNIKSRAWDPMPGDIKINGKDGYHRLGNVEYEAHSIIEPTLKRYIKSPEEYEDQDSSSSKKFKSLRGLVRNMLDVEDYIDYKMHHYNLGKDGDGEKPKRPPLYKHRRAAPGWEERLARIEAANALREKEWEARQNAPSIAKSPEEVEAEFKRTHPEGHKGSATLSRMSNLFNAVTQSQLPVTAEGYKEAVDNQVAEKLEKAKDYKKGVKAAVTAAELGLSGASILGAYANWRNWAAAVNATKKGIANLLQKAQLPMLVGGTLIDAAQTYNGFQNEDAFDTYYNGASAALGTAGSIGAWDIFRNAFHNAKIDRILDVMGLMQNVGDFIKFGVELYNNATKEDEELLDSSNFNSGKDSGIHIKPLNRGKFTALKKRTGKSASWFKAHGTPALKKMATFALNARKWKHK